MCKVTILTLLGGSIQPGPKCAQDGLTVDQEQRKPEIRMASVQASIRPLDITAYHNLDDLYDFTSYTRSLKPGYPKSENNKDVSKDFMKPKKCVECSRIELLPRHHVIIIVVSRGCHTR